MMLLFIFTFGGGVSVSPLVPHDIKYAQRVFTERGSFEARYTAFDEAFSVLEIKVIKVCYFFNCDTNFVLNLEHVLYTAFGIILRLFISYISDLNH
jgi:hypothetical protein